MADPAGAEIENFALSREGLVVVVAESGDGCVVDVSDKTGGAIEGIIGAVVLPCEI